MIGNVRLDENKKPLTDRILPVYTPPVIITYTSEEIMEQIGPAYACSPSPSVMPG